MLSRSVLHCCVLPPDRAARALPEPLMSCCVQDGGGIYATGQASITSANCTSHNNTAAQQGGWLSCSGCTKLAVKPHSSQGDTAGAAGGAIACNGCAQLVLQQAQFTSCAAGDGGAVAAQSTRRVNITGCIFANTKAVPGHRCMLTAQFHRLAAVAEAWGGLYAASLPCSGTGAGGALHIEGAAAASIQGSSFVDSSAVLGGAVSASTHCAVMAGTHYPDCRLSVSNVLATGNVATGAGGVLFSTTPTELDLDRATLQGGQHMLQQWTSNNTVAAGGFGPGAASVPTRFSLLAPQQAGPAPPTRPVSGGVPPSRPAGRRLLEGKSLAQVLSEAMSNVNNKASAAGVEDASGERVRGTAALHHHAHS